MPSGAAYEHPELPEQDRKHGWEQVKELPGIEQPSDVGEIVENGEHLPGHGEHDLVIGDNPNGPGEILLKLLSGLIISADEVVDNPQAIDDKVVIPSDKSHFTDRDRPEIIRNSEIRQIIQNADEVYINGQGLLVFVLYEDGAAKVVHAFNHRLIEQTGHEKPVVSTAYKLVDNPIQEVEKLRLGKELQKIYPGDD